MLSTIWHIVNIKLRKAKSEKISFIIDYSLRITFRIRKVQLVDKQAFTGNYKEDDFCLCSNQANQIPLIFL
jgi:hypothetical protein